MQGASIGKQQIYVSGETSTVVFEAVAPLQGEPVETKTGQLQVFSTPEGAEILVDNIQYGSTPATLSVEAGQHEILVALHEYIAYIDSIDVVGGRTQTIQAELVPIPSGLLEVQAQIIGASIFVDNREKGETPLFEPLRLQVRK